MYWTDVGTDRIERASMDGTGRRVLHNTGLSAVYGLTLDYDTQTLYWADYTNNRIEKSSVDGTNRVLVVSSGVSDPYGITFFDGNLYYVDSSLSRIFRVNVASPTVVQIFATRAYPFDIKVVAKERQPEGKSTEYRDMAKVDSLALTTSNLKIFKEILDTYS